VFLHLSDTATMVGQSCAILSKCRIWLVSFENDLVKFFDGLEMKDRCCQKDGVIFRLTYLIPSDREKFNCVAECY
jgi:hypothetical protein